MAVSGGGGSSGSRGVGEGAESEELTVIKGGNVILSAEHAAARPETSAYVSHVSHKPIGTL